MTRRRAGWHLRDLPRAWRQHHRHAWADITFSERGTAMTIAIMALLLALHH